ncbi:hypothetical protein AB4Y86_05600 [Arthrobacter sp. 2YAF22_2]|uniref:hypothetical protein n=1 Tax=Arthrobacter sp. 2YAF22_2 TaxID=3233029 RepID=UPI003F8EAFF8
MAATRAGLAAIVGKIDGVARPATLAPSADPLRPVAVAVGVAALVAAAVGVKAAPSGIVHKAAPPASDARPGAWTRTGELHACN